MPDDNLFPETPAAAAPEGTPAGEASPQQTAATEGNGADPAGEVPLTMAAAAELITQSQAPLIEKIDQLSQAAARVVQQGQQTHDDKDKFPRRVSYDPSHDILQIPLHS